MATENEPAKLLLPYLQRADELQKHEPLVAYYCRLYAMERGLKIPQSDRTKTTNALLVSLIKQLEKDKKSLKLGPDDHLHVEGFALNVFARADKQDRAGRADLNTAKTFYAASIFFEIVNQFGQLQPDLEEKQKYAVWKAADIRKAMKEGRKPVPGPPGGDEDLLAPSSTSDGERDLELSRTESADFGIRRDPTIVNPTGRTAPHSDSPPQPYDHNFQHPTNLSRQPSNITPSPTSSITPPSHYPTDEFPPNNLHQTPPPNSSEHSVSHYPSENFASNNLHQPPASNNSEHSISRYPSDSYPSNTLHQPPPSNPSDNYPSDNLNPPPPTNNSDHSVYHESYQHLPYQPEPQQHLPQHFPSQDVPSYSFPNFHNYPSFTESSLPTVPSHYPSNYYQGPSSPSNPTAYNPTPQYNNNISSGRTESVPEVQPAAMPKYEYDSSYEPPPEKIAEAHKAARFAVGALAFDDVSTAVDFLKKSLELLTNPSAGN